MSAYMYPFYLKFFFLITWDGSQLWKDTFKPNPNLANPGTSRVGPLRDKVLALILNSCEPLSLLKREEFFTNLPTL